MTMMESISRPWAWSLHVQIDEVDLEAWDEDRLAKVKAGVELLREAISHPEEEPLRVS